MTITIPSYHTLSLPKPHTTYQIHAGTHIISKRYSQFVILHERLLTAGQKSEIPSKWTYNVEKRRGELELYLQSLAPSKILNDWLEMPIAKSNATSFDDLVRDAKMKGGRDRNRIISELKVEGSENEQRRRRDIIANLQTQVPVQQPVRRLGKAPERPETNEELLALQTTMMHDQDDALLSLLPILQRQKEVGNLISSELDEQSKLLDDIGERSDRVDARIKKGSKAIKKFT